MKDTYFLDRYIVSSLQVNDVTTALEENNQLAFEKKLRAEVVTPREKQPSYIITSREWEYYYCHQSYCVDRSSFYSTLKKVEYDAITTLVSSEAQRVKVHLWSYCAVTLWCNGEKVGGIETPVYKPIEHKELFLNLEEGENRLYISLQTLGVRDTRSLFSIEVIDWESAIENKYPLIDQDDLIEEKVAFLNSIELVNSELLFPQKAYDGTSICYDTLSNDYGERDVKVLCQPVDGLDRVVLDPKYHTCIVRVSIGTQSISRKIQNYQRVIPKEEIGLSQEENAERIYENIAKKQSLSRGGKFGFSMPNILARKYFGISGEHDEELLLETLDQIEQRYDCSDFLLSGIIRYMNQYEVTPELADRIAEVVLNYRYWMHMDGADGMCYWSENHAMLFYSCALLIGEMYPDEFFSRAKMKGRDLARFGEELLLQWFDDVLEHDFEEFNSSVYVCITVMGLLNVYDYCGADLSMKAEKALDRIFELIAMHTFDGTLFSPMGRVYRQIVEPFGYGAQSMINLIHPDTPRADGEGWISYFATTTYQFKDNLIDVMTAPTSRSYTTANALIHIEKTNNYCVTSVESPRVEPYISWSNITLKNDEFILSNEYTKSLNERYHGTSDIRPGVYGYQQHLWSVALSNEAFIFANHPGESCDESSMRPGFWYGNGIMPAIRQEKNTLAMIYDVPPEHPIQFVHLFFPKVKFDRVEKAGNWICASKGEGVLGVWCSEKLVENNDVLFDCELRTKSPRAAMYIVASEHKDFHDWKAECLGMDVCFHDDSLRFQSPTITLEYKKHVDTSQKV